MEIMERPRKRKASFLCSVASKKIKDDSSIIINLQFRLIQKTKENENLLLEIKKLKKKNKKIEQYNNELINKNTQIEKELLELKESEINNTICQEFDNLDFKNEKKDYSYSYIN